MKKAFIIIATLAAGLFVAGCAEDFPTILNHEYADDGSDNNEDPSLPGEGNGPVLDAHSMKLGSYNLWISNKGTGDYLWTNRRPYLAQSVVDCGFDIFGLQEANATIQQELPLLVAQAGGNYEWWFVGRDSQDGKNGEAIGIAYNPDRFELTDKHFFWLSETPDVVSYGWGETGYHRIAACATVKDKTCNKTLFMMVTHGPLDAGARAKAAELIVEREKMYNPEGLPSVLVGDMNADPDDAASATFAAYYKDAFTAAPAEYRYGPIGTFQSHSTSTDLSDKTRRIDYIYVRGDIELKSYCCDNSVYGPSGIFPSDHCPVWAHMSNNYVPDIVEGEGTEISPWLLNSVNDWNKVALSINSGEGDYAANACYKLEADIDFADKNFVPIGSFAGTFDGNGFTLKNIVAESGEDATFGLISTNTGVIRSLHVEADITGSGKGLGGIVGTNKSGGIIDGCTYRGTLTGVANCSYIGGIAGECNAAYIINCAHLGGEILAAAAAKSENCGGVCGGVTQKGWCINSYSHLAKIESSNNNHGGIVGFVGNDSYVINSYATTSEIKGGGTYCGAVGYSKIGNIWNVFGNADCSTTKSGASVANDKAAGTSPIWSVTKGAMLTLDEMMKGAVKLPSTGVEYANFAAALSAGAVEFNTAAGEPLKPALTAREWVAGSDGYPVLK